MPVPTVTITGTVVTPGNTALEGKRVTFRLLAPLRDGDDNVLVAARRWAATLDATGALADDNGDPFALIPDDLTGTAVGYEVTEQWRGGETYTTSISVADAPSIDYLDLPRAVTPAAPVSFLATAQALADETASRESADTALDVRLDVLEADPTTQTALEQETARAEGVEASLIPLTQKGAVGGVATLDGAGTVPDAQIPSTIARDAETATAVANAVAALVNSAPGTLDTLGEIATALQADESAAAALTTTVAGKENVVVHGSTASTARPSGATVVHWIGSVAPTNAATNDEWSDTANKLVKRWTGTVWDSFGSATFLAGYPLAAFGPVGTSDDTATIQAALNSGEHWTAPPGVTSIVTAPLTVPVGSSAKIDIRGWTLDKRFDYGSDFATNALFCNADFTQRLNGFSIAGRGKILNTNPTLYPGLLFALYGDATYLADFLVDGLGNGGLWRLDGDDIVAAWVRVINPVALAGVAGSRVTGGKNFLGIGLRIDSGDATFQLVPIDPASTTAMRTNATIENASYIGCKGTSQVAAVMQTSLNGTSTGGVPIMTASITGGFTRVIDAGSGVNESYRTQNRDSSGTIDVSFTDCAGPGPFRVDMQDAFGGIGAVTVRGSGVKASAVNVTGNVTNHVTKVHLAESPITNPAPTVTFCDDFSLNGSRPVNAQTASYTLVIADQGKTIPFTSTTAVTATVPTNASVGYPIGAQIEIQRLGVGPVKVVGAGGVTVSGKAFLRENGRGVLTKTGTDTWLLSGDLTDAPQFRSSSTAFATSASLTSSPAIPAGVVTGDVILASVILASITDTVATPTGWTLVAGPVGTTGGSDEQSYLFSRTVDGTEGSSVTFTKTGTAAGWRCTLTAWQNTAGVGVFASNSAGATATNAPTLPTVTPTVDNSTLVGVICIRSNLTTTVPSQFTQVIDTRLVDPSNNPQTEFCYRGPVSTAALGTAAASLSSTTKWTTFSVVLKHV